MLALAALLLLLVAAGVGIAPRFRTPDDPAPPPGAPRVDVDAAKVAEPVPVSPPETGTFTLKIAVHPYAQVVSLTRDGAAVAVEQKSTPLVIPGLELGSYELVLAHPQLGTRTVAIPRERMRAGKTLVVWGQMSKDPLEVKDLP